MAVPLIRVQSFGSYEIVRKLGSGGMAEVFLALQRMAGNVERPVVIKSILPHLAKDEGFVQMFIQEARIAALLSHPNIVQIYDVSIIDQRPCIVMEFLRGRDLWFLYKRLSMRTDSIRPEVVAAMIAQAATGLDYAHRKRDDHGRRLDLVHRDISPQNLFITREGHIRVLDFGIAKSAYRQHHTEAGKLKGKLSYMAPEQARGEEVDGRADQFALGVILWEVLTGRRLFARKMPARTLNAVLHMPVPPPSTLHQNLNSELDQIVLRALARDPTDRFESCEAFANALRGYLRSETSVSETNLLFDWLEMLVPAGEDDAFYGFELSKTDRRSKRQVVEDKEDDETRVDSGVELVAAGSVSQLESAGSHARSGRMGEEGTLSPPTISAKRSETSRSNPRSIDDELDEVLAEAGAEAKQRRRAKVWPWVWLVVTAILVGGTGALLGLGMIPGMEKFSFRSPARSVVRPLPRPIEIRFVSVPRQASVWIDGAALNGAVFRTAPSKRTRVVEIRVGGRSILKENYVFEESTVIQMAGLSVPLSSEETPRRSEDAGVVQKTETAEKTLPVVRRIRKRVVRTKEISQPPQKAKGGLDLTYP